MFVIVHSYLSQVRFILFVLQCNDFPQMQPLGIVYCCHGRMRGLQVKLLSVLSLVSGLLNATETMHLCLVVPVTLRDVQTMPSEMDVTTTDSSVKLSNI
jgi:hypothetical protein